MKMVFLLFSFLICLTSFGQNKSANADLEDYYPNEYDEPLEIKVMVHVFHYKENDPRNFTLADTSIIQAHIKNLNDFYSTFDRPTLKPDHDVPFIFDSKIRFKLMGIKFYVDSVSWLRWSRDLNDKNPFPVSIREIDTEKNRIGFTGVGPVPFRNQIDSIIFFDAGANNGGFTVDSAWKEGKTTWLKLSGKKLVHSDSPGKFSYYVDKNRNCDSDIWNNVLKNNKDYIHILATGAFDPKQGFGCGPNPYYLNMTNWGPEYKWVGSQLVAHEIGHCIGLNHTNYPQFDDLPKTDKFGWYQCDSTEVSNNIMGYNICRRYLSPKQIAYVHKLYSLDPLRIRTTTQCEYDSDKTMIVRFKKTIEKHTVFRGDIIVKKNKTLTITKNSFLTEQGTIYLEKNAKLIIDGAIIGSACQTSWKGIVKCRKVRKGKASGTGNGIIEFLNKGRITDIPEE